MQQTQKLPRIDKFNELVDKEFIVNKILGPSAKTGYHYWLANKSHMILKKGDDGKYLTWDNDKKAWVPTDNNKFWGDVDGKRRMFVDEFVVIEAEFPRPLELSVKKQKVMLSHAIVEVPGNEKYGVAPKLMKKISEMNNATGETDASKYVFKVVRNGIVRDIEFVRRSGKVSNMTSPLTQSKPKLNLSLNKGLMLSKTEKEYVDAIKSDNDALAYSRDQKVYLFVNNAGISQDRAEQIVKEYFG